jgi:hypothetical protein
VFDASALRDWSDEALSARVLELAAELERLQAELVATVAAWDGRRAWAADGALDPRAWLTYRAPMGRGDAARVVRSGRLVRRHEQTAKALAAGDISAAHVDALGRAVAHGRDVAYPDHEDQLLDAARTLAPRDFEKVAQRWRLIAEEELSLREPAHEFERRRVYLSTTYGGAGVLDGRFDREATKLLDAALDAFDSGPDSVGGDVPPRTRAQRRADALIDLARAALSKNGMRPGGNARLDVVVDANAGPLGRRDFVDGAPLSLDTLLRLLCDGEVTVVSTGEHGEVLYLGRSTRVVSDAQRLALELRDGGCTFPGCDRPASWSDAHHVHWWERGGPTDIDNLVLLCRRHHVLVHEGGWYYGRDPTSGVVEVRPPELRRRIVSRRRGTTDP